jgi:translation initiation factor 1
LPEELCICDDIDKTNTTVTVWTEERRYGKQVTLIEGFSGNIDVDSLETTLKSNLGCGGTVREDNSILLQGEHTRRATNILEEDGLDVEVSEE